MTLAELILAMGLLLTLMLSVAALFGKLMSSSAKSNDQAVGIVFADRVLDRASAQASKTYPAFTPGLQGGQGFYVQDPSTQTQFFYSLSAHEITPTRNALSTSPGESWLLEAEVRWWELDRARGRSDFGNLYVRQARLVYVSR